MICLCSKYVKNCKIFGQILNIWVKLISKEKFKKKFQCLALPKDLQSFGSQNLRCPFWSVSTTDVGECGPEPFLKVFTRKVLALCTV